MTGFSSGSIAKAICDRCRLKFPYTDLMDEPDTHLRVCSECLDQRDPYLLPQRTPDPLALRQPRPDTNLSEHEDETWMDYYPNPPPSPPAPVGGGDLRGGVLWPWL